MKISSIIHNGFRDTRQITLQNYDETVLQFAGEGIPFPTRDQLELDSDAIWHVLLNDYCLSITESDNKNAYRYIYKFKRGFIWDLASVPRAFRMVVDDDDPAIIDASMVHDSNFTCHFLSFKKSNELLKEMFRYNGGSRLETFLAWLAVSSPFGSIAYKKRTIKRAMWQQPCVEFQHC